MIESVCQKLARGEQAEAWRILSGLYDLPFSPPYQDEKFSPQTVRDNSPYAFHWESLFYYYQRDYASARFLLERIIYKHESEQNYGDDFRFVLAAYLRTCLESNHSKSIIEKRELLDRKEIPTGFRTYWRFLTSIALEEYDVVSIQLEDTKRECERRDQPNINAVFAAWLAALNIGDFKSMSFWSDVHFQRIITERSDLMRNGLIVRAVTFFLLGDKLNAARTVIAAYKANSTEQTATEDVPPEVVGNILKIIRNSSGKLDGFYVFDENADYSGIHRTEWRGLLSALNNIAEMYQLRQPTKHDHLQIGLVKPRLLSYLQEYSQTGRLVVPDNDYRNFLLLLEGITQRQKQKQRALLALKRINEINPVVHELAGRLIDQIQGKETITPLSHESEHEADRIQFPLEEIFNDFSFELVFSSHGRTKLEQMARLSGSKIFFAQQERFLSGWPQTQAVQPAVIKWLKTNEHPAGFKSYRIREVSVLVQGPLAWAFEIAELKKHIDTLTEANLKLTSYAKVHELNQKETSELDRELAESGVHLIGRSPAMQKIKSILLRLKQNQSESPVLITGETGTGKEVVANAVHLVSPRRHNKFTALNCGVFTRELIAAELFGYVKGAYTGANKDSPGAIRDTDKGTLFLDEIGELPRDQQPALLRFLENQQVRPVGGESKVYKVDVRIIAATNQDTALGGDQKNLRDDLIARLSVVRFHLPPLRERREDIEPLACHFLHTSSDYKGQQFSEAAISYLMRQPWPGNIRQLRNQIHGVLSIMPTQRTVIQPQDFEIVQQLSASQGGSVTDDIDEPLYFDLAKYRGGNLKRLEKDVISFFLNHEYQRLGKNWAAVQKAYPSISRSTLFRKRKTDEE